MAELHKLSAAQCVLLAVHYAIESNVPALRALAAVREKDLDLELMLRIVLTYLPDSTDPARYVDLLHDLATNERLASNGQDVSFDISSIEHITQAQARRRARKLYLLPLAHPLYQDQPSLDPITLFLIHRSHRIDAETGLLNLVAHLVPPFLHYAEYLRTWFISTVLPLLRLGYEYYPQSPMPTLEEFVSMRGRRAIETMMGNLKPARGGPDLRSPARDLREVVGPWTCGGSARKRRKLEDIASPPLEARPKQENDDWEALFEWFAYKAKEDFPLIASAINSWDGPGDIDLGGFDEGQVYLDEDGQRQLELRYAQVGLACLYTVEDSSLEALQTAQSILARLCTLLSLDPPPGLHVGVGSLPSYDLDSPLVLDATTKFLQDDHILRVDNPLTQADTKAMHLLELFLFSASALASLQHPLSIKDVARLYIRNDQSEQLALLHKILHSLSSGPKKDVEEWRTIRSKLLWLWSWNAKRLDDAFRHGHGILGNVEEKTIHVELLKALLESGHYSLAIQIYVVDTTLHRTLPLADVERVVLLSALKHYENASNGNRTRGGMRRASDIIAAFSPHFIHSLRFRRMQALLAATHSMSFYSLTLQHGVPFQPVNIRLTTDPLSLLRKLLTQNSRSYTHLDDMISIGENLVIAKPSTIMDANPDESESHPALLAKKKAAAERRVIGMAIEAALEEDDFETAYSYVVNRLSPPSSPATSPAASTSSRRYSLGSVYSREEGEGEDVAWRAALMAGKHQAAPIAATWSRSAPRSDLRRLEQRMELLSQAILLAPPSHLEEVLGVWQECEAELTIVLAEDAVEEERYNEIADRQLPGAFANETVATVQPRREVGRGAVEEAPVGLFDVARGAAAAFSKSAFPLRAGNVTTSRTEYRDMSDSMSSSQGRISLDRTSDSGSFADDGGHRVRKRDMVANAVTGGLASGIGWVLGAKPVADQAGNRE